MNQLSIRKMNEITKKKKKGFTLVELIIVIAIIAILAAIAIPKFGQVTRNANIKADIANAKNLYGIAAQVIADGDTVTDANVAAKVDGGEYPKVKASSGQFVVTVDEHNDIHVTIGSKADTAGTPEVYPKPGGIYAS